VKESYDQARIAFQVAYEYQIPSILVYDQKLSGENRTVPESHFDREPNPDLGSTLTEEEIAEAAHDASGKFHRYRTDPENGVSPRSIPGQKGGHFLASGNEHNPSGHISEDPENRVAQVDRRLRKLEKIREDLNGRDLQTYHGDENPEYGIVVWGSQQDTVEEAVDRLNERGHSVQSIGVSQIMPFPRAEMTEFLESVDEAVVVEMNATGQFRGHVQRELGRFGPKLHSLLKYNGNPFEPAEIVEGVEAQLNGDASAAPETTRIEPAAGD
jgi:pyruvate ferredoxin oxidoreductase alpha subunit